MKKFVLVLITCVSLCACDAQYSDGDRVGTITKISYKGIACKSWEGQMAMSNFTATSEGGTSNTFAFSVKPENSDVIKQLQTAQEGGYKVKVHYNQVFMNNPCVSDTDYYVTSVIKIQ